MEASGQMVKEKRERLVYLYSRDQIQDRVRALARAIRLDYRDREPVLVGVLKGAAAHGQRNLQCADPVCLPIHPAGRPNARSRGRGGVK